MGSFTSNITGLAANTTYYVRAYATNSAGTAYGEEVTFTTLSAGGTAVIDEKSCPEAQTVTDHEGNVYATGFSAVPAGYHNGSSFLTSGSYAYFWSSTEYSSSNAYYRYLYYDNAFVYSDNNFKSYGSSVRCLRD